MTFDNQMTYKKWLTKIGKISVLNEFVIYTEFMINIFNKFHLYRENHTNTTK